MTDPVRPVAPREDEPPVLKEIRTHDNRTLLARFYDYEMYERWLLAAAPVPCAASPADPEPTCPGPDCQRCSGEYCDIHFNDPCDCDVVERHSDDAKLRATGEGA